MSKLDSEAPLPMHFLRRCAAGLCHRVFAGPAGIASCWSTVLVNSSKDRTLESRGLQSRLLRAHAFAARFLSLLEAMPGPVAQQWGMDPLTVHTQ